MSLERVMFLLEIVGSIAFAVSGVLVAREKKMDLFGAIVLGCVTACGGGVIRDLLLGVTPPAMFVHPVYVAVSFVTSLAAFIFLRLYGISRSSHGRGPEYFADILLNAADSIGLAAFVVVGFDASTRAGYESGFLGVFVGVITGIGGGILRDMMAGQMPLIMKKRVYGVAAIAGALVYLIFLRIGAGQILSAAVSITSTCLLRFFAIHYRWNLPGF